MPIDPQAAIGQRSAPVTAEISRGRLQFFAEAIGETDPIYTDVEAARAAGHPDLPAPPTFIFGLVMEGSREPFKQLTDLGIDLRTVLHGEERFTYHSVAHAGDRLILQGTIVDCYSKKSGALQFLVKETSVTREDGTRVADMRDITVVRELAVAS